jgi:hypothetical protein
MTEFSNGDLSCSLRPEKVSASLEAPAPRWAANSEPAAAAAAAAATVQRAGGAGATGGGGAETGRPPPPRRTRLPARRLGARAPCQWSCRLRLGEALRAVREVLRRLPP